MTKDKDERRTPLAEETDKQRAAREKEEAEQRHTYPRNMPEMPQDEPKAK